MEWKTFSKKMKKHPFISCIIFWIMVIILAWCTTYKCGAQRQTAVYDTVYCDNNCIKKFVKQATTSGKSVKIYAVYIDNRHDISDLIPVNKTTFEYIQICRTNGIQPQLGIKFRNGQINSIVRFKRRYYAKRS